MDKDRPINLKTPNSQVKNSDPVKEKVIQVDSYTSKINSELECAPKQTVVSKIARHRNQMCHSKGNRHVILRAMKLKIKH